MRDGTVLQTTIYRPSAGSAERPVLLERTPYNRSVDPTLASLICDVLGYIMVTQNVRGSGDSEGLPMVFLADGIGEIQDGYDCIDWIDSQSWCNGNIGMLGASAPGMTQYFAAATMHPALKCAVPILAGPSIYHYVAYQGGCFRKVLTEGWLHGIGNPFLIDTVANHPLYSPFWQAVDLTALYDIVSVPMFHVGGWYDMYTDGQLEAFSNMDRMHGNQKMLIAAAGHGDAVGTLAQGDLVYPSNARITEDDIILVAQRWYNYWLKGINTGILDEPAMKYYLTGDCDTDDTLNWNKWQFTDTWPPDGMTYYPLYFNPEGLLNEYCPENLFVSSYYHDPLNPCPTIGGREFIGMDETGYGPKDQRPIESRSDVLVFSTPFLTEPLRVEGKLLCNL
jgi:predicted acyl esterase